ncbi:alcohol dehydrogenase catalytic domain-containing protein [Acidiphilium sp.]|uniref:alcohol dehydrogenase catalytic domain-containing protein n=1 Tax=Acidiphilium sp. TaxID=527 RepID=UPI003D06B319
MDWVIRCGQVKAMAGSRFPRGLGHEFAGVVESDGPAVTRLNIGYEVLGFTGRRRLEPSGNSSSRTKPTPTSSHGTCPSRSPARCRLHLRRLG